MNKDFIIEKTKDFVKSKLEGEGSGHDWWHIYKVWNNAKHINEHENADGFIVELGALLHDIADWKFHSSDVGPRIATEHLESLGVDKKTIDQVCEIINTISFKGAGSEKPMKTVEGKIVRDADRLEALGAIGIARCFAYGGHKGNPIYVPNFKARDNMNFEEYKKESSQINHFYEKLLLLKDLMLTETGKKIAMRRHEFLEEYLKQFFLEWDGKA
ncbi:MAG: HD domain-containing protein [Nanoarchaeota archaeon]